MRTASVFRTRRFQPQIVSQVFLILLTAGFLAPVAWALVSAFKPANDIIADPLGFNPGTFTLDNYTQMFTDVPILSGFFNTAIVLFSKGLITLFFAPLAGYAFAKYEFRFKNFFFGAVLLTLMLPTIVLIIPLLLEMKELGWVNTYQALVLPGSVDAFAIFWMRQVISAVPDELLDAARVDGCGEFGIFWRIVLPVIRPGIAGLAVLTVMNIYNDFVWPVVITTGDRMQTLQVVLSTLAQNISGNKIGADYAHVTGELLAASSVALIPLLIIFVLLQKHFINGILAGSVKG
ncbi:MULTISPECIES: carbohydrate ABC transporter permease [unclassified Cryobacterium]|uniref:carbohydrate ABC transporter permease n=1 Tax=unclassified Cryobacterium TaxID=2649013 RepID=UPI002B228B25|nr:MULTISPECIES: carbohydrate ABC transporter permease [Cryobacterium]MEB0003773.1 carbohydrate ABC transporter permease [Cryobacterium sp. RTC2.1]MEB0304476.1 carbohydrate ABC transporter permease [Cryobacterium sp. 10I1]MEB0203347.1 carbohydrate ABC transporter permease [Cryobacterium sp. 5I3]MEB0287884.1 carbohydrate ABC transporter permease [Cryobacterium sp. 10S3]MEC5151273.1 ABC-type glycerol-3-phosphate transport system permease component [Cryobacterium psychrotolerans]